MIATWYPVGLDLLALLILLVALPVGYRWSRHDGYEAGYSEGRADRAQEQLAERRAERRACAIPAAIDPAPAPPGRHARTGPLFAAQRAERATAAPLASSRPAGQLTPGMLARALDGTWEPASGRARSPWTDAASIMPVTVPPPPRLAAVALAAPQRGRWPDQDTGMLATLTDTGEIRVADYAAQLRADNEAWLDAWALSEGEIEPGNYLPLWISSIGSSPCCIR